MIREESIEVGKLHAVFRGTIGHQECIEFVEVGTRVRRRRAHALSSIVSDLPMALAHG
jgi:hypothetical protein